MRKMSLILAVALLLQAAVFADGQTDAAAQAQVRPDASGDVRSSASAESVVEPVVVSAPLEHNRAESISSGPFAFTPLSEYSDGSVSIDPNAEIDGGTRFSLGAFYGIFADDYSGRDFGYLSYAGANMQFMFRNDAALFVGVGCFFDGSYLPVEASAEWILARIRTSSRSERSTPQPSVYDSGFVSASPDIPARIGDSGVVFFTLGPGFMAHFPLGKDNPWKISLRANASFSYTVSDSTPLDVYMTLSPGWTRIYADEGTDDAFSMGFMIGFQFRLV